MATRPQKPDAFSTASLYDRKAPPRRRHKRRVGTILLNILIVALILAGVYMIARPRIQNYFQDQKTASIMRDIKEKNDPNVSVVIGRNDYKVDGERVEAFGATDASSHTPADEPATVQINMLATLSIPSIDLTMPVASEATVYSLRIALGHWAPGGAIGQVGNCVIFGHRMFADGRHFSRLHKVKVGDLVTITTREAAYVYRVDGSRYIRPDQLLDTISAPVKERRLTLVTCTPDGGTQRLLVFAHLIETKPIARP